MANKIRIKRKALNSGATAPNDLKWGEIAYNEDGNILYYGGGSGNLSQENANRVLAIGGSGEYVLRDGSNASGIWNITVSSASNAVYTSGNQSITGIKTFVNQPIFNSGIFASGNNSLSAPSSSNSGLYFPVFTADPGTTPQILYSRTSGQIQTDIGLDKYSRSGIDSRTTFPPSSHAITSHSGNNWKVFYTNSAGNVTELALGSSGQVLKSNGASSAPSFQNDNDTVYTHPTQTSITESSADGKVLSAISVNTLGHVTSVGTKTLAENDIPTLSQSKISNLTTDLSSKLDKSGGTMTGYLTLSGDPTNADHAATKGYVDALKQGLDVKDSVRVATTANLDVESTSSNVISARVVGTSLNTIDGVALVVGNRVLIKNQTGASGSADARYNGIYTVTQLGTVSAKLVLTRATDTDASNTEINPGMFTFVEEGNVNADTGWVLTNNGSITVNSTELSFSQFSAAGQIYDGSGLLKVGNTIHIGQGDGISVLTDSIAVNSTVVRTTGLQTITGEKDFENNLKIKPIYNSANVGWFPAFNVEPSTTSQKMVYMTKADLVTALSFETPELGNSFVNTTGNQSISGVKTFIGYSVFKGSPQYGGTIQLTNSEYNVIAFNASGTSAPSTNANIVSGTKILLKPTPGVPTPGYSIGIGSSSFWHTIPNNVNSYEWYAGSNKIGTLYGDGTFNATNISGTNFYLQGTRITSSATQLNLLSFANLNDILIGNGTSFFKQNFITALSGAIISQSGLSITKTTSNLIINHHKSSATSTSNPSGYAIDNIYLDNYGHITGVRSINLDDRYLTSANLNSQISFTSGLVSSYGNTTLTVGHASGSKAAGAWGGNGIKSITIDGYGHITDLTAATYVASGELCAAIANSNCTIDGGTY